MKNKLIGNTPLVKIQVKYNGVIRDIYAKLEYYNLTGSIKDRMAEYVIRKSYESGLLISGMPIVEATSGNTGISFAALGALYGHTVHIFMPDWASEERVKIMQMYGANVYLVSKEEGGFREAIRRADEFAKEIGGFRPNQFSSELNMLAHYEGTGKEIVEKLDNISAFVSGFGTGGTLMGIAKRIKESNKDAKIIAIEPKTMTLLSKEPIIGSHRIEGIGDDFLPDIMKVENIDRSMVVDDNEAINMARRLARELGLGVGISAGANFFASVLSGETGVVTVFADDFKKYISTDLFKDKDVSRKYISDDIELIGMHVV